MAKNNKNGGNVRTVDPKKYLAERRRNKAYWGKRAKQRNTRMIDEAEATARELKKGYAAAETLIEQEVRNIYRGFENAFSLSHAEAKRLIDTAKSETPSKALLDSINRIADPDKRREMQALVSAPAYKWRIDRLDKIQKQAKELSARLYNAELRTDLRFLASQMDEAYKHTIFDIQQGTGGSGAFEVLPESRIKQVLNTKWRGEHFSRRIWGNTQELVTELRQNMLESFMTGESEQDAAARIQERFGVAEFEARRLIRTESTYVCGQAELEGYKNSAVERYEFASLDDDRRSKICERLDGKTFPISKAKPGINYPPMHPFCRSSTLPVLPDEEDLDKEWDDFIAEYVPEDLTFEEWLDGLEPAGDGKLVYRNTKYSISEKNIEKYDFSVNENIISSPEYRSYFDGLFKSDKANSSVCRETRRAIRLNKNTEYENYAFLNGSEKPIHSAKSGKSGGFIDVSCLEGLPDNTVILTHNHPRSSSFSDDDIALLIKNKQLKTIIAGGHNGKVYMLSIGKFDRSIDINIYSRYNILKAENNGDINVAVKKLAAELGLEYKIYGGE